MSCCELQPGVFVCRPNGELKPVLNRRRRRFWCFKCRKHLLHTLWVFEHAFPSYYADWLMWKCPECNEEHITFPGY